MNQPYLLTERLQEYRAAELQKKADNERMAQEANEAEAQPNFLAKFRAELSNRSSKAQDAKSKER